MHVTLAHAALALTHTARIGFKAERDYHTGQAMRLVNDRIASSSKEALSDATIFAVGCLTQFEVLLHCGSAAAKKKLILTILIGFPPFGGEYQDTSGWSRSSGEKPRGNPNFGRQPNHDEIYLLVSPIPSPLLKIQTA